MRQSKWLVYQKERFPLLMYIPMIAAFSLSAVSYSAIIHNDVIHPFSFVVSFLTSLSFFMLLRISDEHKDFEDDSKYRPYRAVPRGLVKLKELFYIGVFLVLMQLVLGLVLSVKLLPILLLLWFYFFLMNKEFFRSKWLKKHAAIYMLSHMFILPILDLYAAACNFLPTGNFSMVTPLVWFLITSFFNGMVIEIGRKLRAPGDEETGVDTYSFLWGRRKATGVWLGAMLIALLSTLMATYVIGSLLFTLPIIIAAFLLCLFLAIRYVKNPTSKNSKILESISGLWAITDYFCLGILPFFFLLGGGLL